VSVFPFVDFVDPVSGISSVMVAPAINWPTSFTGKSGMRNTKIKNIDIIFFIIKRQN
jgi:hypothetical protein